MAMNAKEAYGAFLRKLKAWLQDHVGSSEDLKHMVGETKVAGPSNQILRLPGRGGRMAYLRFAQNPLTQRHRSKVLIVEFSVGSKLSPEWLESQAANMMPIGSSRGVYNNGKGDVFFALIEWCNKGGHEWLACSPVRQRLYHFALDAVRFAGHAFRHEASL